MQLKPLDRVIVRGYKGREVEGVVVSLHGELVGITTPDERDEAGKAGREPVVVIGFPARDVRPLRATKQRASPSL